MPAKLPPYISVQRPWEESVGPDGSITHCTGGKRMLSNNTYVSQVPLPVGAPLVADLPVRNYSKPKVDTDLQLWKAYRNIVNADDNRLEGKKMCKSHIEATAKTQAKVRHGLRDRLRRLEEQELKLQQEQMDARQKLANQHRERDVKEEIGYRERVKSKGFEGLRKPMMKPGPASPSVSPDLIEGEMKRTTPGFAFRSNGKKMLQGMHISQMDSGKPFGSSGRDSEPMQRWQDKSFT